MTDPALNRTTPVFSPLEPIFAPFAGQVPLEFREQFLHSADYPYDMTLDGVMHEVWHKPRWLGPLYWTLGQLGVLVPYEGREVPTTVQIVPGVFSNGQPFQRWQRTLRFDKTVRFNTTFIYDPALRTVVELAGPGESLGIAWTCRFEPPSIFTLNTQACALNIGARRMWLPSWLWPLMFGRMAFTQEIDAARDDTAHINLVITHPILGEIFGYKGTFRAVRTPK